ncbi:MAG: exodeoxyribonuclease VII large subunit, partial [Pseudomonadota bacterium]
PTAAAEQAVPVRSELVATTADLGARGARAMAQRLLRASQRLTDLSRALPRPDRLLEERRQRLDNAVLRLPRPGEMLVARREAVARLGLQLPAALRAVTAGGRLRLTRAAGTLSVGALTARLAQGQERLEGRAARLGPGFLRGVERGRSRFDGLARLYGSLHYGQTLKRGFAIVRAGGEVVPAAAGLSAGTPLEIEFRDGKVSALTGGEGRKTRRSPSGKGAPDQGSLF